MGHTNKYPDSLRINPTKNSHSNLALQPIFLINIGI